MLKFVKMVASGNDFIIVDNRETLLAGRESQTAHDLCQRKFAIGADGLLLLEKSSSADFKMRIFNPDGSEVGMCGNGSRCIAKFAWREKIAPKQMKIETLSGEVKAEIAGDNVKVEMKEAKEIKLSFPLEVEGKKYSVSYLIVGVPHVVLPVDDLDAVDVVSMGRAIRYHPQFQSEGTNVDFISVKGKELWVRTYERGVEDETFACGTGVTASAIIFFLFEKVNKLPITLHTRGDSLLKVNFKAAGEKISEISLEGDAKFVYEGKTSV